MLRSVTISLSYPSISHAILFHHTPDYISITNNILAMLIRDYFWVENVESAIIETQERPFPGI